MKNLPWWLEIDMMDTWYDGGGAKWEAIKISFKDFKGISILKQFW